MNITVTRSGKFYVCSLNDEHGQRTYRTQLRGNALDWLFEARTARLVHLITQCQEAQKFDPRKLIDAAEEEAKTR